MQTRPSSSLCFDDPEAFCSIQISSSTSGMPSNFCDGRSREDQYWGSGVRQVVLASLLKAQPSFRCWFLASYSWWLGLHFFLACRVLLFIYVVLTLCLFAAQGAFDDSIISLAVHVMLVLSTFMAVLSSSLALLTMTSSTNKKANCASRTLPLPTTTKTPTPNTQIAAVEKLATSRNGERKMKRLITFLNGVTILCIQNTCAIVLFWNTLLWLILRTSQTAKTRSALELLSLYNMIPVIFELALGSALFRYLYFLPGTAVVVGILIRLNIDNMGNKESFLQSVLETLLMFLISCTFIIFIQRAKVVLIRRFHFQREFDKQ